MLRCDVVCCAVLCRVVLSDVCAVLCCGVLWCAWLCCVAAALCCVVLCGGVFVDLLIVGLLVPLDEHMAACTPLQDLRRTLVETRMENWVTLGSFFNLHQSCGCIDLSLARIYHFYTAGSRRGLDGVEP